MDKVEPPSGRDHLVTKRTSQRENLLPNPGESMDPWTGQEPGEISPKPRVPGIGQRESARGDVESGGLFERCISGRRGYVPD
jgi:hypothetical protein